MVSTVVAHPLLVTDAEINEIGEGFLTRTFPGARFHHREHLIMTTYLLARHPSRDWHAELPGLIRAYNVAQGGVNDDTRGYHHTITMAYLTLVRQLLDSVGRSGLQAACRAVLGSPVAEQDILFRFYTKARLLSREARKSWIEPDLTPLGLP